MSPKRALPAVPLSATDEQFQRAPAGRRAGTVLNPTELAIIWKGLAELILRRTKNRQFEGLQEFDQVRTRVADLLIISQATSDDGTEPNTTPAQLEDDDLLTAAETAELLDCSREWVGRLGDKLGGRKVGGRWLFPRRNIIQHLEGMEP